MLKQEYHDMGVTELISEKDRVRAHKERELELLGVQPKEITAQLDRDLEIKEMVELILDKALYNKTCRDLEKGLKQCL